MTKLRPVSALTVLIGALALTACERRDDPPPPPTGATAPAERSTATTPATPPTAAAPADRPAAGATAVSDSDRKFVEQAASAGMAEVEITQHTIDKAASAAVKKVAEHLHRDHSQANRELMRIAAGKGMTLPRAPGDDKRAEVEKLRSLSGPELDRTVVDKLAESHRESIKLFERQAADGSDADLRAFAEKTLPTLREHLKMVESTKSAAAEAAPQAAAKP